MLKCYFNKIDMIVLTQYINVKDYFN